MITNGIWVPAQLLTLLCSVVLNVCPTFGPSHLLFPPSVENVLSPHIWIAHSFASFRFFFFFKHYLLIEDFLATLSKISAPFPTPQVLSIPFPDVFLFSIYHNPYSKGLAFSFCCFSPL